MCVCLSAYGGYKEFKYGTWEIQNHAEQTGNWIARDRTGGCFILDSNFYLEAYSFS